MTLDANQFTGYDVTPYMPFIENSLMWFDVFYQQQQQARSTYPLTGPYGNESLVIYPGSGAETYRFPFQPFFLHPTLDSPLTIPRYKEAYNPSSTIAGLRAVLTRLLQVDPPYLLGNTTYYEALLSRIPPTPLRQQQNHTCISPAQGYSRIQNVEIPQLYPVFPWGEYGLGLPNLSHAINTYLYDEDTQDFHSAEGWKQDGIWLARMGLTQMARNITRLKLEDSKVHRFPTFWGPNFDWTPDINNGGAAMVGLQEMVLQTFADGGKQLRVGAAWPKAWDGRFKLHAPFETVVEGRVMGGKVEGLSVTPEKRREDVVLGQEG